VGVWGVQGSMFVVCEVRVLVIYIKLYVMKMISSDYYAHGLLDGGFLQWHICDCAWVQLYDFAIELWTDTLHSRTGRHVPTVILVAVISSNF